MLSPDKKYRSRNWVSVSILASFFGFLPIAWAVGTEITPGTDSPRIVKVLSRIVTLDKVFLSMKGPEDAKNFKLLNTKKPELLWVVGGKICILNKKDGTLSSEEHLCHAYMKFDQNSFNASRAKGSPFAGASKQGVRLFTFVQGQPEIQLPKGYGIPVMSNEVFDASLMFMNAQEKTQPLALQAESSFYYWKDAEMKEAPKPLFMRIFGLQARIDESGNAKAMTDATQCGMPGGEAGEAARPADGSQQKIRDNPAGFKEVYHWMVPPGRHTYRYVMGKDYSVPFDTPVHFINAHLHPFGESVELYDVTAKKILFKSRVQNYKDRVGIEKLDDYSSEKGEMVYKDHQYELVAVYNNTTDRDIDAMAIIFLYLEDKTFDKNKLFKESLPSEEGS